MDRDLITFVIPERLFRHLGKDNIKAIMKIAMIVSQKHLGANLKIIVSKSPNIEVTFCTKQPIAKKDQSKLRAAIETQMLAYFRYYSHIEINFTLRDD